MKKLLGLALGALLAWPVAVEAAPIDFKVVATCGGTAYIVGSSGQATGLPTGEICNAITGTSGTSVPVAIDQSTPGTTNGVSLAYIGPNAIAVGSGVMNTGTPRFALATDSPGIVATSTVAPGTAPGQALVAACIYNSSLPTFTAGQTGSIECDVNGRLIITASGVVGTPAGGVLTTQTGGADPCEGVAKTSTPINIVTATTTQIIAAVSAKKTYICSIFLYPGAANNVALVEDATGSCASPDAGMLGGTTAATGEVMTAQSGFVLGNGKGAVAITASTNVNVCLITSAGVQLSGNITWVQAP